MEEAMFSDNLPFYSKELHEAPTRPSKPHGRRLERMITLTKKQTRERLKGAGSLAELMETVAALDREGGKPVVFSRWGFKAPKFGGLCPDSCDSQYHQKAVDIGLFGKRSYRQLPRIISWDENSVLARGVKGLLLLSREEFGECFSAFSCPFCGTRYIVGCECGHVLAVNDQVLEFWYYRNAEEVYDAWRNERWLFKDMPSIGPKALPGSIVASCRMTGPAYRRWGSVSMGVLFAPDALLGELRDRDRKQWDSDRDFNEWSRKLDRICGMGC